MINKKIFLSLAGLAAVLLSLQPGVAKELVIEKGVIDKDTTWSGEILVQGDVEVAKGATLLIMPGTTVRFAKIEAFGPEKMYTDKDNHFSRAEIFVLGKLYAQGTKEKRSSLPVLRKSQLLEIGARLTLMARWITCLSTASSCMPRPLCIAILLRLLCCTIPLSITGPPWAAKTCLMCLFAALCRFSITW